MNAEKKNNLEKTYERILNVGFCIIPYEDLSDIISADPMIYGTAKDERILSFEGVEALFKFQYEQIGNMKPSFNRSRIALQVSNGENNACIVEEITLKFSSDEENHSIFMRATCMMEYLDNKWKLTHWHTSTPVDTENDPWHMEEWKREKEKLQQLVDEQTATLRQNNRELQIEAALERVRSRSMAMTKSEQLSDVILEIHHKFKELDISMESRIAIVVVFDSDGKDFNQYIASNDVGNIYISTPYFEHPILDDFYAAKESGVEFFSKSYTEDEKNSYFKTFFETSIHDEIEGIEEQAKWVFEQKYYTHSQAFQKSSSIGMADYSGIPLNDSEIDIIKRFSKVFDQAYTRFLDLKKAEKQAREAQIEAALERVRNKALAMHSSEDISFIVNTFFNELKNLNISMRRCGVGMVDLETKVVDVHVTTETHTQDSKMMTGKLTLSGHYVLDKIFETFKTKEEYHPILSGKDLSDYYRAMNSGVEYPEFSSDEIQYGYYFHFKEGGVFTWSDKELPEEDLQIFRKFTSVLSLTYRRYLDLKESEAQAREAQIETAIEKVRASSMSIQKSDELIKVVRILNTEIKGLGIDIHGAQIITDFAVPEKGLNCWFAQEELDYLEKFHIPYFKHPITENYLEAAQNGIDYYKETYSKKEKDQYYEFLFQSSDFSTIPKERQDLLLSLPVWLRAVVISKNSALLFQRFDLNEFTKEHEQIFKRFGKVFEQAYTRFLDLQKAEAQAREAQIETAIEKVRASSMSIQKSDELIKVVQVVNKEIKGLGIDVNNTQIITDFADPKKGLNIWFAAEEQDYLEKFHLNYVKHTISDKLFNATKNGTAFYKEIYSKKEKNEFLKLVFQSSDFINIPKERQELLYDAPGLVRVVVLSENSIIIFQRYYLSEFTKEHEEIFKRFGKVFEQAYTRFLDLKKAEEQARESQIEAALERVRSRSMAMHKSNELRAVVNTIYNELRNLKVNFHVACIQLLLDESKDIHLWIGSEDGVYKDLVSWPYVDIRIMNEVNKARLNKSPLEILLTKTETKEFFEEYFKLDGIPKERKAATASVSLIDIVGNFQANTSVFIMRYSEGSYTEDEKMITERFSKVFEQTYTRFLDLQKAEAREREAVKQASLDRVRGEIASMRTAKDLERITPLVWKELTALGVPFFRCGVFIIREDEEMVRAYLSTPDGKSVAALHLPFKDEGTQLIIPAVDNWRKQKPYKEEWDQEKFIQQMHSFMEKGQIENPKSYQVMDTPPERLVLHLVPFRQGMLYVGHSDDLNQEQLGLVESLALTFSVAYSRYEDFKALEDAKNSLELTLTDLKATQTQLIQSEKMASLGELTAGIAHEIQNPLNFVNNFSEVSKELLEEMQEELENGDIEEVKAIMQDIIQNLNKINHHGKRADGIVKGMLQHSRASGNKKESTDINALADEYLRLAYHGLRAKDKSFNAELITDFDKNIGKVKIIPQDIGRVILNLLTNAFYACAERLALSGAEVSRSALKEKQKEAEPDYKPTIRLTTKKQEDKVIIEVTDNGNGMSDSVKDKIFQPFFTTKPTGEGTGLGLSMSYDIITKGHGGKLEVETKKDIGTTFTINLPTKI